MAVKKTETAAGGQELKAAEHAAKKEASAVSAENAISTENEENTGQAQEGAQRREAGIVKLVYIGPSLPKAMLKTNSIFEGTKEEIAQKLSPVFKTYKLAEKLLVPVSKLAEKKDKIKTAGNVLNKYYSDLASEISAAGKGE